MALSAGKQAELHQAFNLYCIFDTETGRYDKNNDGTVSTANLKNVLRAVGMCPTAEDIDAAEAVIGGPSFNLTQARAAVELMSQKQNNEEHVVLAYKTMAEDDPDGMIHKDRLWQKMRRQLPDDETTNRMIADANPNPDTGMIDYRAFVKRQFDIRELTISLPRMEPHPTREAVEALLLKLYGDAKGPPYPYKYKTGEAIAKELSGHGGETRKFLDFGREQQAVVRDAIAFEVKEKVVEAKLKALHSETNPLKVHLLLRELDSFYTGHNYLQDLEDIDLSTSCTAIGIKDEAERAVAKGLMPKLEATKTRIEEKWRSYGRK